jgi:predicted negative regulator of RcsB-dependent stress response
MRTLCIVGLNSFAPGFIRGFLVCWLIASPAFGQDFAWTPGLQQAYADISKLKIQAARQTLTHETDAPGADVNVQKINGLRIFLDDYADMMTLLITDDEAQYNAWAIRQDQRLDQLRRLNTQSPYYRLTQAEVRLHWAFVKLKFGREMSACWDIIKAYKLLAENQKRFPNFIPTYKSLGLLHVLIGSVPDNYGWVARLLGLRGNVQQGLAELDRARQDPSLRTEARLIDGLIRAYILKFSETDARQLAQLVAEQPDNALLPFFGATISLKNGQGEQALAYLTHRPTGPAYLPMPITENLLGDVFLQKGQYPTAAGHYTRFLAAYRGQNFLKDTHYKLFLCDWLAGNDAAAMLHLRRVVGAGRTVVEADKAAQKFADSFLKKGASANQKVLMRARLATDGGFADEALAQLKPLRESSFLTMAEKAEFNYRLGRIQQRRDQPDAAIPHFVRAIALCDGTTEVLSFGATSALQLGYIYQQKKDRAAARTYFEKALSYPRHEYKNSIDNKARAALNGLGN